MQREDGAPGRSAKTVQSWCNDNLADFWPKDFWPASTYFLNPLDFGALSITPAKAQCATYVNALCKPTGLGQKKMKILEFD